MASTAATRGSHHEAMLRERDSEESSEPPAGAAVGTEEAPLIKLQSSGELKVAHRRKPVRRGACAPPLSAPSGTAVGWSCGHVLRLGAVVGGLSLEHARTAICDGPLTGSTRLVPFYLQFRGVQNNLPVRV